MKNPVAINSTVFVTVCPGGVFQNKNSDTPAMNIYSAQTRGVFPEKNLSVSHPLNKIPNNPATSNAAVIQLPFITSTCFDSLSIVGPQSATLYRIVYTKKFANEKIQIAGFLNTISRM